MDLKLTSEIATTIGVIISTLTLLSAYSLYRIGKRDEYIKSIRNIMISYQYNSSNLNRLLTYDIIHELVQTVVNSKQVDKFLSKIYNEYIITDKEKSKLEDELENMYPITISIHTELLNEFNSILRANSQEASKIYTDYRSLYRVYESVNFIFTQTIEISKHLVRDEDIFKDIILNAFEHKNDIKSSDEFKDIIFNIFMSIIHEKLTENDQLDVNDVLSLLTISTNSLMRLTDKKLYSFKKREKKILFKEFDETNNIFEDLLEAEKGLRLILREDELLKFREFSTKIKVRNEANFAQQ